MLEGHPNLQDGDRGVTSKHTHIKHDKKSNSLSESKEVPYVSSHRSGIQTAPEKSE